MSAFDLREIEFQSDGIRDSLTMAMAPELFHQTLQREIASAKRGAQELVIVSLVLRPDSFASKALFEEGLIGIAFSLRTALRGEDFFTRMSDAGFWVALRTPAQAAPTIIERWKLPYNNQISVKVLARGELEYPEWIQGVDQLHFN